MKRDKIKIYIFNILLLIILFFTLFVSNIFNRIIFSIFLTVFMIIITIFLKKKNALSMHRKQVIFLMLMFAVIYLILFYLMGLYFGFYESTVKFSLWTLLNYIVPLSAIIISTEIIRSTFIANKAKYSMTFIFIITVLIDLIIYTNVYDLTKLSDFLTVIGFIFFASCSCNLLYNYVSVRFGHFPIIVYRLITVLYIYIIPITPDVYIFFSSFIRMIYPYAIYLTLEYGYAKSNFVVAYNEKKKNVISTTLLVIFMILITMLVSCKFQYGILVIGSGSMTGAINKGDAIIFEQYTDQEIKVGDVIVFKRDKIDIVHRVIDIKKVNNTLRYYTKGDANVEIDDGYVVKKDIVGTTKLRIMYIGYPTIWIKELFEGN